MKYIGLLIAVISVICFSLGYCAYLKKRSKTYGELSALLTLIRERLSEYPAPLPELCRDSGCEELTDSGFIKKCIEDGEARQGAELLPIDEGDRDRLAAFFEAFGRAFSEEELSRVGEILGYFQKRAEEELLSRKEKAKLCAILSVSLLIGLTLMCL